MTQATIGALRVSLGIDSANFSSGLKKSQSGLDKFARAAKIGMAAAAAAGVAAGAAMSKAFMAFSKDADSLAKLSQSVGVSVEALSELRHAAELSGVEFGTFTKGLEHLSRRLDDAASNLGGEAARAFRQLGVAATDSSGRLRDPLDALDDLADAFAAMEDGSLKTSLAVDLLSRSGAALIPMLNTGASGLREMRQEASDLGLTISGETARRAEKFNDNLSRMSALWQGVTVTMSSAALPAFESLSEKLLAAARDTNIFQQIGTAAGKALTGIATALESIAGGLAEFARFVSLVERLVKASDALSGGALMRILDAAASGPQISQLSQLANRWLDQQFPSGASPGGGGGSPGPAEVTVNQPAGLDNRFSALYEQQRRTAAAAESIVAALAPVNQGIASLGPSFERSMSGIPTAIGSGAAATTGAVAGGAAATVGALNSGFGAVVGAVGSLLGVIGAFNPDVSPRGPRTGGFASGGGIGGGGAFSGGFIDSQGNRTNSITFFDPLHYASTFQQGLVAQGYTPREGGGLLGLNSQMSRAEVEAAILSIFDAPAGTVHSPAPLTSIATSPQSGFSFDQLSANEAAMRRFADAVSPDGTSTLDGSRGDVGGERDNRVADTLVGTVNLARGLDAPDVAMMLERRLEQFLDDLGTRLALR